MAKECPKDLGDEIQAIMNMTMENSAALTAVCIKADRADQQAARISKLTEAAECSPTFSGSKLWQISNPRKRLASIAKPIKWPRNGLTSSSTDDSDAGDNRMTDADKDDHDEHVGCFVDCQSLIICVDGCILRLCCVYSTRVLSILNYTI
jgi:hypothetical protein